MSDQIASRQLSRPITLAAVSAVFIVYNITLYYALTRVYGFGNPLTEEAEASANDASDEMKELCRPLQKSTERNALLRFLGISMFSNTSILLSQMGTQMGTQMAVIGGREMSKRDAERAERNPWSVFTGTWSSIYLTTVLTYFLVARLIGYGDPLTDEERNKVEEADEALKQKCRPLQERSDRRALLTYMGTSATLFILSTAMGAWVLHKRDDLTLAVGRLD